MRPVGAKALIINAFAPTERFAIFNSYRGCFKTQTKRAESPIPSIAQGSALGKKVYRIYRPARATLLSHRQLPLQGAFFIECHIPRALPWAMEICPFGARCLNF